MRKTCLAWLLAAAALPAAAGSAQCSFRQPDQWRDAGRTAVERERTGEAVADIFRRLAARLPEDQVLKIELTDVDLAGEPRWTQRGDLRVVTGGADRPRLDFAFALEAGGRVLTSGTASLADLDYQSGALRAANGDLPYERRLLERWFERTFARTAPDSPRTETTR